MDAKVISRIFDCALPIRLRTCVGDKLSFPDSAHSANPFLTKLVWVCGNKSKGLLLKALSQDDSQQCCWQNSCWGASFNRHYPTSSQEVKMTVKITSGNVELNEIYFFTHLPHRIILG
ncbi:hypothetical protein AVEN_151859-1 [Araneus ventricosus]|uniref:Uncharacterized protein n=1 Tax=Araneus ventricosus TaxID=182803 RepID=A0A4Y2JJQ7_ARAVE|nr:hypothetical protein AVEN_151859-1 [Araneus ventricosus]